MEEEKEKEGGMAAVWVEVDKVEAKVDKGMVVARGIGAEAKEVAGKVEVTGYSSDASPMGDAQ